MAARERKKWDGRWFGDDFFLIRFEPFVNVLRHICGNSSENPWSLQGEGMPGMWTVGPGCCGNVLLVCTYERGRKMKKSVLCCLVLLLSVLLGMGAASKSMAQEKVYINGIDANFPPFAFVDKEGKPDGFDVAIVDLIAKEKGFKVKHQPMD
ncbi:MAG: transporter substrate-binding domain-containing protein, partial [Syntrophobacteraceae bacterium]